MPEDPTIFRSADHEYIVAVDAAYEEDPMKLSKWLTNICPECDGGFEDADHHEFVADTELIAIGCQGYWVISPEAVGLPLGNWCDWREGF